MQFDTHSNVFDTRFTHTWPRAFIAREAMNIQEAPPLDFERHVLIAFGPAGRRGCVLYGRVGNGKTRLLMQSAGRSPHGMCGLRHLGKDSLTMIKPRQLAGWTRPATGYHCCSLVRRWTSAARQDGQAQESGFYVNRQLPVYQY